MSGFREILSPSRGLAFDPNTLLVKTVPLLGFLKCAARDDHGVMLAQEHENVGRRADQFLHDRPAGLGTVVLRFRVECVAIDAELALTIKQPVLLARNHRQNRNGGKEGQYECNEHQLDNNESNDATGHWHARRCCAHRGQHDLGGNKEEKAEGRQKDYGIARGAIGLECQPITKSIAVRYRHSTRVSANNCRRFNANVGVLKCRSVEVGRVIDHNSELVRYFELLAICPAATTMASGPGMGFPPADAHPGAIRERPADSYLASYCPAR